MELRVLIIGDDRLGESLRCQVEDSGVVLVVTDLPRDEVYDYARNRYIVSERGLQLLRDATPELYDAILICNNTGVGLEYAAVVPEIMRAWRTMIVWLFMRPEDPDLYTGMGYQHFGNKQRETTNPDEVIARDFLLNLIDLVRRQRG